MKKNPSLGYNFWMHTEKKILADPKDYFTFRSIDVRKISVQWPLLENFVPKVFRANLNFKL